MTVTDGVTNSTTTLEGIAGAIAVNPVTNKVYVANVHGNVTVIDGATNAQTCRRAGKRPCSDRRECGDATRFTSSTSRAAA